jgi:replicative DNA helicase
MKPPDVEALALRSLASKADTSPADAAALLDELRLEPTDFRSRATQALFVALAATVRDGKAPDAMALLRTCGRDVPRELVVDTVTTFDPSDARQRLAAVKADSRRRGLVALLHGALQLAQSDAPLGDVVGELHRVLGGVTPDTDTTRTSEADVIAHTHRVEAVQRGEKPPVLATGIEALDFVAGGLQPTLTVIGAMPGVGKSALLATIIGNLARRGERVGLLSLEDERMWVANRLIAEASGIPVFVLGNRPLGSHQLERYGDATARVYEWLRHVVIEDTHGLTPHQVVASARQMVAMGCRAVLVDHLGEVRLERSDRHDLDIAEALSALRGISKRYKVPVVVACHMKRRDGLEDDKPPRLSDFAFSAAVERMARVALGLFRDKSAVARRLGVAVLKQTNGPSGFTFTLNMHERSGTVAPTEPTDAMREKYSWEDQ